MVITFGLVIYKYFWCSLFFLFYVIKLHTASALWMRDPHVAGGFLLQKEDLWACCQMMQILCFFLFTSDFIPIVSIWNGSQCIPNNPAIINKICVVFLLRLIVTSARLFPLTEVAAWVRLLTMPIILEWVNKMTEIGIIYWNKRF